MRELANMFWVFMKIGGLTFGGGYAMLPMLQSEVVEKHGWATEAELLDCYAIGQCTPGIISVNVATYIGYRRRGLPGAALSTFGVVFPSLVIIMLIASFLQNISQIGLVAHAFAGIRVAVAALILSAIVQLWSGSVVDRFTTALFFAAFAVSAFTPLQPVAVVIAAALCGVAAKALEAKREAK